MVSRRQFLLGASGAVAGALALPALAATGWAQDVVPAPDAAAREAAHGAYAVERAEHQSPVDIVTAQVTTPPNSPTLVLDYPDEVTCRLEYVSKDTAPAGCSVRRDDETVQALGFSRPAYARFDGDTFQLLQFHFHTRSEHTVDGTRFAMEQHFVHERVGDGKLMVIGVLLVRGGNAAQDRVLATLPAECDRPVPLTGIRLRGMFPRDLTQYRYPGSLTTPDFREGVRWHVLRSRVSIAGGSVDRFRGLFPDGDNRPVQPLNGRTVRLTPGRLA